MPVIRISQAREGLTLTKDVKNDQEQLLLKAGVDLLDRHITLLKAWGVAEVEVSQFIDVSSPVATTEEDKDKARRVADARMLLTEILRLNDLKNPFFAELFDLCVRRKAKVSSL